LTKIEAYLRPNKLDVIKSALGKFGIHGMTVLEVIGCGLQKGHTEVVDGEEYDINLLPKIKIEVIVADNLVDDVVKLIADNARTNNFGDGKIFTYAVGSAMRIRTGETGEKVI
jgi:nitrogen regulatory protein P-II 1